MSVVVGPWGKKPIKHGPLPGSLEAVCWEWLQAKQGEFRDGWYREAVRLLCRNIWPTLGNYMAKDVGRRDIDDVLAPLPRGTARNTFAVVHAVLRWSVETGRLESNPVAGVRRRKAGRRERVLSLEELKAVWCATAGAHDFDRIVRLLMLTGQRRDEIGGLMWGEVKGVVLELPGIRTKNGRPHRVPLAQLALACLPARKAGRHYVFGRRANWSEGGTGVGGFSGWSKCKARLDARCGVVGWTLHDLRRSFVTHSCELELAPPHVVEAFVNHQSGHKGGVAGIYNRAEYWKERCRLAEAWAALFNPSGGGGKTDGLS